MNLKDLIQQYKEMLELHEEKEEHGRYRRDKAIASAKAEILRMVIIDLEEVSNES